jgi:hypothetical protein
MFTFRNIPNTQIQWPEGAVSHLRSTERLSSIADDLNSFSSGAKINFSFAQASAGESFGSLLIFAAR